MPKKIKRKAEDDFKAFDVCCKKGFDTLWVISKKFLDGEGYPVLSYCKEVCQIKCSDSEGATIVVAPLK